MKTFELEYTDPQNPDRPGVTDWVLAADVAEVTRLAIASGLAVANLGPVSWQRQLARMENNPDN